MAAAPAADAAEGQKFLLIGLVGSENPTRANFPFVWAAALREAGNEVRIELAGAATVFMRTAVSNSVAPVGWPPFSPWGVEEDFRGKNAQFTNPKLTAKTMAWATKILVV